MARLQWFIHQAANKFGLSGFLAWLLLLSVIVFAVSKLLPLQNQLSVLEEQLQALPESQQITHRYESESERFFDNVPHFDELIARLQTVFDTAKRHNIEMGNVAYRTLQSKEDGLTQYNMAFSVTSSYPVIKSFILDCLANLPFIALDKLSIERNDEDNSQAVAHLQFTLFWTKS